MLARPRSVVRIVIPLGLFLGIVAVLLFLWAANSSAVQGATLTVTSTADTATCGTPCSLGGAIAVADSGDTINIPAGTYTLTQDAELSIYKDLTLTGAGSGDTIIQAASTADVADFRVFNVTGVTVAISGMAIRHGNLSVPGGGIHNSGILTLASSTVSGNRSENIGGGIFNNGALSITDSTVSGNSSGSGGGGIMNNGTITLTNSTVSGNTAGKGGGIWANFGTLALSNSTVSGNTTNTEGGGIYNSAFALTVTNSTVSGNTATEAGGGIFNTSGGTLTLTNSTITGNVAETGKGGGIRNVSATSELVNTIIAENTAATGPDCSGLPTSLGYNLIEDDTDCGFAQVTGDVVNTNPLLGPLADNGGPTLTHALLPGSPAIDAGDDAACPATDQRGVARPHGAHCDIGAYEFAPGANFPPVAFDQAVTARWDRPVAIKLTGSDPDSGDALAFIIVSLPGSGGLSEDGVSINSVPHALGGDTVTYGPDHGFTGADTFTFRVNDGLVDSAGDGAVTINVIPTCNGLTATIVGTDGPDVLIGTAGADVILGMGGDDTVLGMEGDDTICLGEGDDFGDGGPGRDRVWGEDGDDDIRGGAGKDRLYGGRGEDVLRGGKGNDRLYGGNHDDVLKGGAGRDRLFGQKGHDFLVGGKGNDRLIGRGGDDVLLGRAGDDSHICGAGYDFANGGPGVDTQDGTCESIVNIP